MTNVTDKYTAAWCAEHPAQAASLIADYEHNWADCSRALNAVAGERDALAVHVERLVARLEDTDWLLGGCMDGYEECWTKTTNKKVLNSTPGISLTRQKLLWQAEALEEFSETLSGTQSVIWKLLRYRAKELRRQAKGEE